MNSLISETCQRLGISPSTFNGFPLQIQNQFMFSTVGPCEESEISHLDNFKKAQQEAQNERSEKVSTGDDVRENKTKEHTISSYTAYSMTLGIENINPTLPNASHFFSSPLLDHAHYGEYDPSVYSTPSKMRTKSIGSARKNPYESGKKNGTVDSTKKRRQPRKMALDKQLKMMSLETPKSIFKRCN